MAEPLREDSLTPGSPEWYAARLYGSGTPAGKEAEVATANRNAFATDAAYMTPVIGESMSARDAWDASGRGGQALTEGRFKDAAGDYANMLAAGFGALPVVGTLARGSKRVASWMDKNLPESVNAFSKVMPDRPQDQTNIFAGPKAQNANHVALARAQEMEGQGIARGEIWRATGWGRGVDGKWRFEIDDSAAKLTVPPFEKMAPGQNIKTTFGSAVDHPDLAAAYPGMAERPMQYVRPSDPLPNTPYGMYVPNSDSFAVRSMPKNVSDPKSVTLHEAQHAVQAREGFAIGGQPIKGTAPIYYNRAAAEINDIIDRNGGNLAKAPPADRDRVASLRQFQKGLNDYEIYRRLVGETEARNVQTRMNMTAAERRQKAPWETQDVPDEHQIIRDAPSGGPQRSVGEPQDVRNARYFATLND